MRTSSKMALIWLMAMLALLSLPSALREEAVDQITQQNAKGREVDSSDVVAEFHKWCMNGNVQPFFAGMQKDEYTAEEAEQFTQVVLSMKGAFPKLAQRLRTDKAAVKSELLREALGKTLEEVQPKDDAEVLRHVKKNYEPDQDGREVKIVVGKRLGTGSIAQVNIININGEDKVMKMTWLSDRQIFSSNFDEFQSCYTAISNRAGKWVAQQVGIEVDQFKMFLEAVLAKREPIMDEFDLTLEENNTREGESIINKCADKLVPAYESCHQFFVSKVLETTAQGQNFTFDRRQLALSEGWKTELTMTKIGRNGIVSNQRGTVKVVGKAPGSADAWLGTGEVTAGVIELEAGDTLSECHRPGGKTFFGLVDSSRTPQQVRIRVPQVKAFGDRLLQQEFAPGESLQYWGGAKDRYAGRKKECEDSQSAQCKEDLKRLDAEQAVAQDAGLSVLTGVAPMLGCMLLHEGTSHADPHSGNIKYDPIDRSLWLIDWGANVKMDLEKREPLARLISTLGLLDVMGDAGSSDGSADTCATHRCPIGYVRADGKQASPGRTENCCKPEHDCADTQSSGMLRAFCEEAFNSGKLVAGGVKLGLWRHMLNPTRYPSAGDDVNVEAILEDLKDPSFVLALEVIFLLSRMVQGLVESAPAGVAVPNLSLLTLWSAVINVNFLTVTRAASLPIERFFALDFDDLSNVHDVTASYLDTASNALMRVAKTGNTALALKYPNDNRTPYLQAMLHQEGIGHQTAFTIAIERGDGTMVDIFLQMAADVSLMSYEDANGATPLIMAAKVACDSSNTGLMKAMDFQMKLNALQPAGFPFGYIYDRACNEHAETLKALLNPTRRAIHAFLKSTLDHKDNTGKSARDYAAINADAKKELEKLSG